MSGDLVPLAMPSLGMTMREGRVVAWRVPVGAAVARGDVVVVIESEKTEFEVEAPRDGVLRHVFVDADQTVACGTLLGVLAASADVPFDAAAFQAAHGAAPAPAAPPPAAPRPAAPRTARAGAAPATPAARALARAHGVDVASVRGSGPGGRITREDVEAALGAGGAATLEVLERGEGDAVLLLPGFAADVSMFAPQAAALAAGHRVVAANPRGVGASTSPPGPRWDVAALAADAAALLDGPAHVVGASLGAAIALELALAAPARVRSLVLITPFLTVDARLAAVVDGWCAAARLGDAELRARVALPWLFAPATLADEPRRERIARGLAAMASRIPADTLARTAAGLRAWSGTRRDDVHRLRIPTLVIAAGDDLLTPDAAGVAEALGARLVTIAGAGHAVTLEAPDAVLAALLGFLAGPARGR